MSSIPDNLKYTASHEWIRIEGDTVVVGITDHAQAELTDIVYVELPEVGRTLAVGEGCGVVESVKTASDLYAPIAGEITEINSALEDAPEQVNESPYDEGWCFKMKLSGEPDLSGTLDAAGYASQIGES